MEAQTSGFFEDFRGEIWYESEIESLSIVAKVWYMEMSDKNY
jgi:hypothetical protein